MEVTFSIPDHISAEDAQAIIASFMAAQSARDTEQVEDVPTTDVEVESIPDDEDDEQVEQADEPTEERSYSSSPGMSGDIPTVVMSVVAREGGFYGDMSVIRLEAEAEGMRGQLTEYAEAAYAASLDPDRKRPPRAEPELVDAAVKYVVRKMHNDTRAWITDEGPDGYNPGWGGTLDDRRNLADTEHDHIGFTISENRKRLPYTMAHNSMHQTAWGLIELIKNEFGAEFTKAQVRTSVKRLTDSGFIIESGTCGKSARYRIADVNQFKFATGTDTDA